jgi:probable HAF family extracellular repeat protein
MIGLGDLPGGDYRSNATGISSDGSIIVGGGISTSGSEAFRWTSETGMVGLGDLPGGSFVSTAKDISEDGSVIVGTGATVHGIEAFIWDDANGLRSLKEVLVNEHGLEATLAGWQLDSALSVSANGNVITGRGINPSGQREAWVVVIPEPSSFIFAVLAITTVALRGFRKPPQK